MKKILITGKGSYIGTKVQEWLEQYPDKYSIDVLDMLDGKWKEKDFAGYDVVYHVAGIAHRNDASDKLYEKVNHIMATDVFKKCCDENVQQFIFMSSGAVYTQSDRKNPQIVVNNKTALNPSTAYGRSKLEAEKDIQEILKKGNKNVKVAILRPPMVYGKCAQGNYQRLRKAALTLPVFPKINNLRSMIYIDNLCEFIKLLIDGESEGIFLPQNKEYVNTSELVTMIASANGKKILLTPIFNGIIKLLGKYKDVVNKAFGSYVYDKYEFNYFDGRYQVVEFDNSIYKTEK